MPTSVAVSIQSFAFSPLNITIAQGGTVKWTNKDGVDHTATAIDGSWGLSQIAPNGGTFSHTFNTPGTFEYLCADHAFMAHGFITVVATSASSRPRR